MRARSSLHAMWCRCDSCLPAADRAAASTARHRVIVTIAGIFAGASTTHIGLRIAAAIFN